MGLGITEIIMIFLPVIIGGLIAIAAILSIINFFRKRKVIVSNKDKKNKSENGE